MNLKDLVTLIPSFTAGFLATSVNNIPDVRGWQYLYEKDRKFYFTTSTGKNIYKQLLENPNACFICNVDDYTFRITGKVNIIEDRMVLQEVFERLNPEVKAIYKSIDENDFCVFTIENGTVRYAKGYDEFQCFSF